MLYTKFDREDAEEIAASYVNGNISYVRQVIGDSIIKYDAVYDAVLEIYGNEKAKMFRKTIISGN